jgi:hypothetical protein
MAPEVGTWQWMASEVGEDEKNTEKYTKAADVLQWFSLRSSLGRCHLKAAN